MTIPRPTLSADRPHALSRRTRLALGISGAAVLIGWLLRSNALPRRLADPPVQDPIDTSETLLARRAAERAAAHPGLTGVHLLSDAHDAFAARMLLAAAAERRLDLQYYVWQGDRTGTLLLEEVHRAAERGVEVRLLLDDNGISGLDEVLAALDAHPNIEVRLFNPFRIRFPKSIGYVLDFRRLNRRMHNKSFTVDGAVTIVGGRNVGDEYFGGREDGLFADLDALAVGRIVPEVLQDFDRYWACASVYPARQILRPLRRRARERLRRRASIVERDPSARRFVERLTTLPTVRDLVDGTLHLDWCSVRLLSDDPAKGAGKAKGKGLLTGQLQEAIGPVRQELGIVTGYFVPGEKGAGELARLARGGVEVMVITNGFATTDVALVHAGYAPWRDQLLEAGVTLYELNGTPRRTARKDRRLGAKLGVGSRLRGSGKGAVAALRSHASTLHAKTFTIDRERLFVGSFNFDPRSAELNTEMGFLIESPTLAAAVADRLAERAPEICYRVERRRDGALEWIEQTDEGDQIHAAEPGMNLLSHLVIGVARRLPIQWLL